MNAQQVKYHKLFVYNKGIIVMKFALIGVGYVAPRHMKAIKETGHELIAALDPHDSVGILDSYFPNCKFFTKTEQFDRYLTKNKVDYISICSPNYLHEFHCKMALRLGANVICEKPLVLCNWNLPQLEELEKETGKKIYNILQLRLHKRLKELKDTILDYKHYDVELKYITPRGEWYHRSWKGNEKQSGGIETNIGIHFFDMLIWMFGKPESMTIEERTEKTVRGNLDLECAEIKWMLSVDRNNLPDSNLKFFRSITVSGKEIRFDDIISDFHIESYKEILAGRGFTIKDVMPAIELVTKMRDKRFLCKN